MKLRDFPNEQFSILNKKFIRFARDNIENLKISNPIIPIELNDRASDNWNPLLAIAELASDDWTIIAREAAVYLSGTHQESPSIGVELLQDIKNVFEEKGMEKLSSKELVDALISDDEAPWATYNKGQPISLRQLGSKLKPYGIQSKNMRLPPHFRPLKGYESQDFIEAFSRYILVEA